MIYDLIKSTFLGTLVVATLTFGSFNSDSANFSIIALSKHLITK